MSTIAAQAGYAEDRSDVLKQSVETQEGTFRWCALICATQATHDGKQRLLRRPTFAVNAAVAQRDEYYHHRDRDNTVPLLLLAWPAPTIEG